jgi:hypothetical protein
MGSVGKGQSSEIIPPQRQDGNEGSNAFFEAFSRWRRVDGDVGRNEIVAD